MSDQPTPTATPRIFHIGTNDVVEDPSTAHLSVEQMRKLLQVTYPEVAYATVRERDADGFHHVEFSAIAGHKG